MSYRTFRRPDSAGWTTANWVTWAAEQGLLLDVRNDIPDGVCTGCYGGTKRTYEDTSYVQEARGLYPLRTERRRWPRGGS